MIDYSKDLTRFSPCLPSSLGGTVYSGPILLRNLASQYGNTQTTMLDELYGRLDLSLESLATPDSLLDELGVTGHIEHGHSDKELFEKFQRRESDPLALQKNFEKEFYLQK